MFASVHGSTISGIEGFPVRVEVDVSGGLPCFEIVGMADTALRESKHRVRSALRNSGFETPSRRVTVNLAPAAVHKEGSQLDVAIALGILAACGQVPQSDRFREYCFLGELALDGSVRSVKGALAMGLSAKQTGRAGVVVPCGNGAQLSVLTGLDIRVASRLGDIAGFLSGKPLPGPETPGPDCKKENRYPDMSEIRGQVAAKRALEVAASGGHNILMAGSPGSGKSMLAKAIPGILPRLSHEESLEVTRIQGIAGLLPEGSGLVVDRPFRAPHHTVTAVALIGGGVVPGPGEVTLAHRGVLFLDELPEFSSSVLNALRQPVEEGQVLVTRSRGTHIFPSRFLLVAAMNPCRCGWFSDDLMQCTCTEHQRRQYLSRVNGPFLDRVDLHLELGRLAPSELVEGDCQDSASIRRRVQAARELQERRYRGTILSVNAEMGPKEIAEFSSFSSKARKLALDAFTRMNLSSRAYYRVLKVATTVADLALSPRIEEEHVGEALAYRQRAWAL